MLLIVFAKGSSSLWCIVESAEAPLDTGMRRCDGFNRGGDAAPAASWVDCSDMGVSGHRHAPV